MGDIGGKKDTKDTWDMGDMRYTVHRRNRRHKRQIGVGYGDFGPDSAE